MEKKEEFEGKVADVPIEHIKVIDNIRTESANIAIPELMDSIKQEGLLSPIGLWKRGEKDYVLVFGFRRLTACKKLGWRKVPAIVREDLTMKDVKVHNILENLQREDISPIELGRQVELLTKDGMTTPEIAVRLGKAVGQIKTALGLYEEMPEKYREKVIYNAGKHRKKGTIPAEAAKRVLELGKTVSQKDKERLLHHVLEDELSLKDIGIVSKFMRAGLDVKEAVKSLKEISIVSVDIPFETIILDAIKDKYEMSINKVIKHIVYGKLPPLKSPNRQFLE